jgi:predicted phosphate transport protein (TIGR00153 family)
MNLSFLQKKNSFYFKFEQAAKNNALAAKELQALCKSFKNPKKSAEKIHELEHKGDTISHEIFDELYTSFVTPLDREDIIALTHSLDDFIDLIHAAADDMNNYSIKKPTVVAIQLANIITEMANIIEKVVPYMRKRRDFPKISKAIIEINDLESKADQLFKQAIRDLFKKPKNAIEVVKWHAIYQTLEDITDKAEDIGDVFRGLIIKYA